MHNNSEGPRFDLAIAQHVERITCNTNKSLCIGQRRMGLAFSERIFSNVDVLEGIVSTSSATGGVLTSTGRRDAPEFSLRHLSPSANREHTHDGVDA